jgi:hypothetical protein
MRTAIASASRQYQVRGYPFDPVAWLGDRLTGAALDDYEQDEQPRLDASTVWDSISYQFIKNEDYKADVASVLLSRIALRRSNKVSLTPQAVKLIDAMADAVVIPHTRGQRQYDVLPTPERKQQFRALYPQIADEAGI